MKTFAGTRTSSSAPSRMRTMPSSVTLPITSEWSSQCSKSVDTSALVLFLRDDQHPLLRLAEHDLVPASYPTRAVAPRHVDLDAGAAPRRALDHRARQPGRAKVLQPNDPVAVSAASSRQASISSFSRKGLPTCTAGRSSSKRASRSVRWRAVAPWMPSRPGVGADEDERVADARSPCARMSLSLRRHADAHRVHQRVAIVGAGEPDLAADGRDAEAVAIATDARRQRLRRGSGSALARSPPRAEAQRIEHRDRPRAHREDVAHDAADAGRRALVGLDRPTGGCAIRS